MTSGLSSGSLGAVDVAPRFPLPVAARCSADLSAKLDELVGCSRRLLDRGKPPSQAPFEVGADAQLKDHRKFNRRSQRGSLRATSSRKASGVKIRGTRRPEGPSRMSTIWRVFSGPTLTWSGRSGL